MIRKQIKYWTGLTWWEFIMVIIACEKGAVWFQRYLDTLIYVVKHLTVR
jgi:hypothetical protein